MSRTVRFKCGDMSSDMLVSALGSGKYPHLEKFITTAGAAFNDEVVLAFCSSHPNLQSIHVEGGASVSLSSIAIALTHCPHFVELNTKHFQFSTVSGPPYYRLQTQCSLSVNWREVLDAITKAPFYKNRVRVFQPHRTSKFANEDVESIIDTFGKDLHVLIAVVLGEDVSHGTLDRLVRECTDLRTLYLNNCSSFTDELVTLLAEQCHHLVFLSLAGAVHITDSSMCHLLSCLGNQLRGLYIDQCPLLTDTTLIAIAASCGPLEALDITKAGITAEAVITHLIKPDRLLKLIELTVGEQMLGTLIGLLGKENEVSRRWGRILDGG